MANYIKFLFLSFLLLNLPIYGSAQKYIFFKGDYFIYSDDLHYLYGSGNIQINNGTTTIKGNEVYFDMNRFLGVIYGNIQVRKGQQEYTCDALFFKPFPFTFLCL